MLHPVASLLNPSAVAFDRDGLNALVARFRESTAVVAQGGHLGIAIGGALGTVPVGDAWPVLGVLPPLYPEWLGDRGFCEAHGVRFAYIAGEMANGIATTQMVIAMAQMGGLGMFGAAGLSPGRVEAALVELNAALGPSGSSWGSNLIHSPSEPSLEEAIVDLYLRHGVRRVSASAYMALTPAIVRYAVTGLRRGADGHVERRNHVLAKISRPEVATRFLEPAPPAMLQALLAAGQITAVEAELAAGIPLAEDLTVESDSGGHTDNRPLGSLFPTIAVLRDRIAAQRGYARAPRLGAAGGLGTPDAVAAAFALGAAYVLTGSVNQSAVESGLSLVGRQQLAQAGVADVIMAPAADMFELGVHVQVLRRGTLFASRARRLLELYREHDSLESIEVGERARLEREVFQQPLDDAWASTRAFWLEREPTQVERAESDPKHRMALVFRSYLGLSSRWAIAGTPGRAMDFQIWSGPAMGAFNDWVRGSYLEPLEARTVGQIGLNLLEGAAQVTRAQQLRSWGVQVPDEAFRPRPRPMRG